ncbi:MAG: dipeptide epimerase [Bacteroidetes bacterium]|nr:dipeptide epimerase [Bacteroidota bacterium]
MLQLQYKPFELAFNYPFTTSKGTKTHQPTLIVSLGFGVLKGYGEAPAISYYNVSVDEMIQVLEEKAPVIRHYALMDPKRFWHFLEHLIPHHNFLIAALDIAGWDLFAKMKKKPLYQLLGLDYTKIPQTDFTIGIDETEIMVQKLLAQPAPIYKVKISEVDQLDLVRELRKHTDVPFRVDANEALTFEEVKHILNDLKSLGVTMLEQPLKKEKWDEMKELKAISPIALFADESCVEETEVVRCKDAFHGINIKLTKCGGITPALRMIEQARSLDLQVMIGSMNESTVGSAAMAHLLPLVDAADMDGILLLKEDVATGLSISNGYAQLSNSTGLGVDLAAEKFLR